MAEINKSGGYMSLEKAIERKEEAEKQELAKSGANKFLALKDDKDVKKFADSIKWQTKLKLKSDWTATEETYRQKAFELLQMYKGKIEADYSADHYKAIVELIKEENWDE